MGYFKQKQIDEQYIGNHFIGDEGDYEAYMLDLEEWKYNGHKRISEAANTAKARVRTRKIQSGTTVKRQ